jgi:hypothetical protein
MLEDWDMKEEGKRNEEEREEVQRRKVEVRN